MRRAIALALLLGCTKVPEATGEPPTPATAPTAPGTAGPGAAGTCASDADCHPTGCSGSLCASSDVITTCEHRPEFDCYREPTTSCGCFDGHCSWAPTDELRACVAKHAPP